MLGDFWEFLLCGGNPCGRACGKWGRKVQGEDANFWRDLTFLSSSPNDRPRGEIPDVVLLGDPGLEEEVSLLNEDSTVRIRAEHLNPTEDVATDDMEIRSPSVQSDDDSDDSEFEKQFFEELRATPIAKHRSQRSLMDCDGSSYSTQRKPIHTLQSRSTESTTKAKTKNHAWVHPRSPNVRPDRLAMF